MGFSIRKSFRAGPMRFNVSSSGLGVSTGMFAALGDETPLRLVIRLSADGPMSIARLADATPVTRQAVTKRRSKVY